MARKVQTMAGEWIALPDEQAIRAEERAKVRAETLREVEKLIERRRESLQESYFEDPYAAKRDRNDDIFEEFDEIVGRIKELAASPAPLPNREQAAAEGERIALLAELAWVLIANAYGGDWTKASQEWQDAAARWRDEHYYKFLDSLPKNALPEREQGEEEGRG